MDIITLAEQLGVKQIKKQSNGEFSALCPFHKEKTPSLSLNPEKNLFNCFGCGESGDIYDLHMKMTNSGFKAAKNYIDEGDGTLAAATVTRPKTKKKYKTFSVKPTDKDSCWHYRQRDGALNFVVTRWQKDGKKIYSILSAVSEEKITNDNTNLNRTVYNLQRFEGSKKLIVVEGEKCADYLQEFIDTNFKNNTTVVSTIANGANSPAKTDMTPFAEFDDITLFPDNDKAGINLMRHIANMINKEVKIVDVSALPPKGDVADLLQDGKGRETVEMIKNARKHKPYKQEEPKEETHTTSTSRDEASDNGGGDDNQHMTIDFKQFYSQYFDFLGMREGSYYFFNKRTNELVPAGATSISKMDFLLRLAPLAFWNYILSQTGEHVPARQLLHWADYINREGERMEPFNNEFVRGVGTWLDGQDIVFNNGRRVFGKKENNGYYYTSSTVVANTYPTDTVDVVRRQEFINVLSMFNWAGVTNVISVAGWIVSAIVCGALKFRPHIWLAAPTGSGKTSLINKVIKPALGTGASNSVLSSTTAGLRRQIGNNAQGQLFDELDPKHKTDKEMVEQLMVLLRVGSSESGGIVMADRNSNTGTVMNKINASFFLSGIYRPEIDRASQSRIAMVELSDYTDEQPDNYWHKEMLPAIESLDEEYYKKLRWTAISETNTINHNADIFANSMSGIVSTTRMSELIGALYAGYHFLNEGTKITDIEEAREKIKSFANLYIKEQLKHEEQSSDYERVITAIMQIKIKCGQHTNLVGSLIDLIKTQGDGAVTFAGEGQFAEHFDCKRLLQNIGIDVITENGTTILFVNERSEDINAVFNNDPQLSNKRWSAALVRAGGERARRTFSRTKIRMRGIAINLDI